MTLEASHLAGALLTLALIAAAGVWSGRKVFPSTLSNWPSGLRTVTYTVTPLTSLS